MKRPITVPGPLGINQPVLTAARPDGPQHDLIDSLREIVAYGGGNIIVFKQVFNQVLLQEPSFGRELEFLWKKINVSGK